MEIRDVYNCRRQKIGTKSHKEELCQGEYLLAVHIWFINSEGNILIQKRSLNKKYDAGKWSATGGHAISGEDSISTCLRETREELGFTPDLQKAALVLSFLDQGYIFDVWLIKMDIKLDEIHLKKGEASETKWVSLDELKNMHFETGGMLKNGEGESCQQYQYMDLLYLCIDKFDRYL